MFQFLIKWIIILHVENQSVANEKRDSKKKTRELFAAIKNAIKNRNYYFTAHAVKRSKERKNVNQLQIIKILKSKSKYHESHKDHFNEDFKSWNYSIRGFSVDFEEIRIILSFDKNDMLIITVINLNE